MLSVCCRIGWEGHMLIMYINYQCGSGFNVLVRQSESWKWKLKMKVDVKVESES